MHCGDALLLPAPASGVGTPHLWILVTEPDPATHLCVIVSVTTLREGKDQTVILDKGDHPFIRHSSTVFFSDAMLADARRLEADIATGTALPHASCSPGLLKLENFWHRLGLNTT